MDNFLKSFNAPTECFLDKTIFKKHFMDNVKLDATEKKALKEDIEKISLLYSFNEANINIPKFQNEDYNYVEVFVLNVELKSDARIKKIVEFINKAIPYPILMVFSQKNKIAFSTAHKKINKVDKTKGVVEDIILTSFLDVKALSEQEQIFIDSFKVNGFSFNNFFDFYDSIQNKLLDLQIYKKTGKEIKENKKAGNSKIDVLKQIEVLEQDIISLKSQHKKESMFNKKMKLNMAIKKKEKAIKKIEEAYE